MPPDPYWVCEGCAHFWAAPEHPDRCEHCHSDGSNLTECADMEAAEEQSQIILKLIMEGE